MDITDKTLTAANRRGAAKKSNFPAVVSVRYDRRVARANGKLGGRPRKDKGLAA